MGLGGICGTAEPGCAFSPPYLWGILACSRRAGVKQGVVPGEDGDSAPQDNVHKVEQNNGWPCPLACGHDLHLKVDFLVWKLHTEWQRFLHSYSSEILDFGVFRLMLCLATDFTALPVRTPNAWMASVSCKCSSGRTVRTLAWQFLLH